MNKQELIEKIESLPSLTSITSIRPYVDKKIVLGLVRQLDEPQKVVVPKFVADWYEENKDSFEANLYRFVYNLTSIFDSAKMNEFERWFLTANTKPFQILINMHQFGYEVEKEKRYLVKVKGVEGYGRYLNKVSSSKTYCFASENEKYGYITKHTRKELEEAGFGWVFDCEGIEIEEVD